MKTIADAIEFPVLTTLITAHDGAGAIRDRLDAYLSLVRASIERALRDEEMT